MSADFSHVDEHGRAFMVDVTAKETTLRRAEARARVFGVGDLDRLSGADGDVLGAARVAGLGAAKQTSMLIPLCHPIPLTDLEVEFTVDGGDVEVRALAETIGQTGVEIEALTACAIAALSILAAAGPTTPGASIGELTLWDKRGGRSGHWSRLEDPAKD